LVRSVDVSGMPGGNVTDKTWSFDSIAERYDAVVEWDTRTYYARYGEVLDAVVTRAGAGPGVRVLDIGTGTGNLAVRCLAVGASVVGLDPSEPMLARAREKVPAEADAVFRQCDEPFLDIPYPDGAFDAVVSTYAYHHIPHRLRGASVREMVRVLAPGGRWVLGDLCFQDAADETRALRELNWLEEEYFTRLDELRAAFAQVGMEIKPEQFTPATWVVLGVRGRASPG